MLWDRLRTCLGVFTSVSLSSTESADRRRSWHASGFNVPLQRAHEDRSLLVGARGLHAHQWLHRVHSGLSQEYALNSTELESDHLLAIYCSRLRSVLLCFESDSEPIWKSSSVNTDGLHNGRRMIRNPEPNARQHVIYTAEQRTYNDADFVPALIPAGAFLLTRRATDTLLY